MLTDSNLRSKIDGLWDKLWAGGMSNPMDAIEQLSFLLFLKRLDEREQDSERAAKAGTQRHAGISPGRGRAQTPLVLLDAVAWRRSIEASEGKGVSIPENARRGGRLVRRADGKRGVQNQQTGIAH